MSSQKLSVIFDHRFSITEKITDLSNDLERQFWFLSQLRPHRSELPCAFLTTKSVTLLRLNPKNLLKSEICVDNFSPN